jgi:hypothetical protein
MVVGTHSTASRARASAVGQTSRSAGCRGLRPCPEVGDFRNQQVRDLLHPVTAPVSRVGQTCRSAGYRGLRPCTDRVTPDGLSHPPASERGHSCPLLRRDCATTRCLFHPLLQPGAEEGGRGWWHCTTRFVAPATRPCPKLHPIGMFAAAQLSQGTFSSKAVPDRRTRKRQRSGRRRAGMPALQLPAPGWGRAGFRGAGCGPDDPQRQAGARGLWRKRLPVPGVADRRVANLLQRGQPRRRYG